MYINLISNISRRCMYMKIKTFHAQVNFMLHVVMRALYMHVCLYFHCVVYYISHKYKYYIVYTTLIIKPPVVRFPREDTMNMSCKDDRLRLFNVWMEKCIIHIQKYSNHVKLFVCSFHQKMLHLICVRINDILLIYKCYSTSTVVIRFLLLRLMAES